MGRFLARSAGALIALGFVAFLAHQAYQKVMGWGAYVFFLDERDQLTDFLRLYRVTLLSSAGLLAGVAVARLTGRSPGRCGEVFWPTPLYFWGIESTLAWTKAFIIIAHYGWNGPPPAEGWHVRCTLYGLICWFVVTATQLGCLLIMHGATGPRRYRSGAMAWSRLLVPANVGLNVGMVLALPALWSAVTSSG